MTVPLVLPESWGENSKITDDVTDMLFEAACLMEQTFVFHPRDLVKDASSTYGLDPNNAEAAINRACELLRADSEVYQAW